MRILQLSTTDFGGGAEQVALRLHRAFLAGGHESLLAVGRRHSELPGIVAIPMSGSLRRRAAKSLTSRVGIQYAAGYSTGRDLLRAVGDGWDVVVAHNLHGDYLNLTAVRAVARTAPLVAVLHDMWMVTGHCAHPLGCARWADGCGSCPDLTIYPAVERDLTRVNLGRKRVVLGAAVTAVTSPGAWLLDQLPRTYLAGKPTRHIHNPVDLAHMRPGDRVAARIAVGLPPDRPVVFATGGLRSNVFKDSVLLDASATLDSRPVVMILDDLPPDPCWPAEVRALPTTRDDRRMAMYYNASDVVVSSSRAETSPLSIAEAQACGVPVVATRVGGVPELVEDGVDGLLYEPGDVAGLRDRLSQVLGSAGLRHSLEAAALDRSRARHDQAWVASQWLEWFGELSSRISSTQ